MIRKLIQGYGRWRRLNHEGLNEDDFVGLRKFERAKAIAIVVATMPTVPLMLSDEFGIDRGWLWYGWAVVAVAWLVGILALVAWSSAQSFRIYMRNWRDKTYRNDS